MQNKIDLYYGILTIMAAFAVIATGFIIAFMKYQKKIYLKQQELYHTELEHKKELISTSIQTSEAERTRIAKDIHDEIGGIFSTLMLSVNQLEINTNNERLIHASKKIIQEGIQSVRRISHSIIPFELEILGLKATLENYLETIASASGKDIQFSAELLPESIPAGISLTVYRVLQELISNSIRHGNPEAIKINLFLNDDLGKLYLEYKDNGCGMTFHKRTNATGIGIKNIESRVVALNGNLLIDTAPGRGYSCIIDIPFEFKENKP